MLTPLSRAPVGASLTLVRIVGEEFAERIGRLGLHEGGGLVRLDESVAVGPVKVRGPRGEAVLGGGLAAKVIVHLDDDRRLPLLECAPGEEGHVEGLTGAGPVVEALAALGITENDRIAFVRRLPPMTYHAVLDGKTRLHLDEGLAAKLLGETAAGQVQFCSVGVGEPFDTRRILAGESARETLAAMGVKEGSRLILASVGAGQVVRLAERASVVCVTGDGLRLLFREKDAERLLVSCAGE